ncbi:hypothetical protein [Thalassococcus profundi]|uniref:hypothetical protein n=1 Tax=Thalassococcus profundi TaxID=2282382 RepID=UPI004058E4C1
MTLKKLALATTALTMLAGTAWAGDDNNAFLDQDGANNIASITQSGDRNDAGTTNQQVTQTGYGYNTLTIDQSGSDNAVGLGSNADSTLAGVTQTRGNNSGSLLTRRSNEMSITQTSGGNTVGSAVQVSSGQGRNDLTITQDGSGSNVIRSVYQRQSSSVVNIATITQEGSGNTLARVSQSANEGGNYNPNEITVTMSDTNNGAGTLNGAAVASGALSSTLIQGGSDTKANKITLVVSGDQNQFGVSQYGNYNTVGTLTIGGSENEVGVYQEGSTNSLSLGTVSGTENNLGLRQVGSFNTADVDVMGSYNGVANGFGSNVAGDLGLTAGLMVQFGDGNSIDLTVTGANNVFASSQSSTGTGAGTGNSINGTQDNSLGGAGHQVAVLQTGMGNGTTFNQTGSGHVAAFSQ